MGEVVFWTIIRTIITIPIVWVLKDYISFPVWWLINLASIYGVIIHPAIIHYRLFKERNKEVIEYTLCSTCTNFDKTAVLCVLHDEHPTKEYLPCEGFDWEPQQSEVDNLDIFS
ncbi:MAG: hypothetical protein ACYDA4_05510 [Ignavibacteriaceae bacterium]